MSSKTVWTAINISDSSESLNQEIHLLSQSYNFKKMRLESDEVYNRSVLSIIDSLESILEFIEKLVPIIIRYIDMRIHKGVHFRMGAIDVIPFISLKFPFNYQEKETIYHFGKRMSEYIPVYYYGGLARTDDRIKLSNIRKTGLDSLKNRIQDFLPDEGTIENIDKTGACVIGIRKPLIAFNMRIKSNKFKLLNDYVRSLSEKNGGIKGLMSAVFRIDNETLDASFNIIVNQENTLYNLYLLMDKFINENDLIHEYSDLIGWVRNHDLFQGFENGISLDEIKETYKLYSLEKSQIIDEELQ